MAFKVGWGYAGASALSTTTAAQIRISPQDPNFGTVDAALVFSHYTQEYNTGTLEWGNHCSFGFVHRFSGRDDTTFANQVSFGILDEAFVSNMNTARNNRPYTTCLQPTSTGGGVNLRVPMQTSINGVDGHVDTNTTGTAREITAVLFQGCTNAEYVIATDEPQTISTKVRPDLIIALHTGDPRKTNTTTSRGTVGIWTRSNNQQFSFSFRSNDAVATSECFSVINDAMAGSIDASGGQTRTLEITASTASSFTLGMHSGTASTTEETHYLVLEMDNYLDAEVVLDTMVANNSLPATFTANDSAGAAGGLSFAPNSGLIFWNSSTTAAINTVQDTSCFGHGFYCWDDQGRRGNFSFSSNDAQTSADTHTYAGEDGIMCGHSGNFTHQFPSNPTITDTSVAWAMTDPGSENQSAQPWIISLMCRSEMQEGAVYKGSTKLADLFEGSTSITQVYEGTTSIFSKSVFEDGPIRDVSNQVTVHVRDPFSLTDLDKVSGDLLIAIWMVDGNSDPRFVPTAPTGWTERKVDWASGAYPGLYIATKVSDGTETAVQLNNATLDSASTSCFSCFSVKGKSWHSLASARDTGGSPNPPANTNVLAGDLIIVFGGLEGSGPAMWAHQEESREDLWPIAALTGTNVGKSSLSVHAMIAPSASYDPAVYRDYTETSYTNGWQAGVIKLV